MNHELSQILQNIEKPKISIIMQTYLEKYPGSRDNAIDKFRRAVRSFQNQLYKNAELIIVSDGCNKTYQIYSREFKNDPNIKFVLVDRKDVPLMYTENEEGKKYYRGFPRKVGISVATGELITYMDADDFLIPQHTLALLLAYNAYPEKDWWINRAWYDNNAADWPETDIFEASVNSPIETFFDLGLGGEWRKTVLKENKIVMAPWLIMHRASCTTQWRDTLGYSEDVDFSKRLRSEYPNGSGFQNATYVRCHYVGVWDV